MQGCKVIFRGVFTRENAHCTVALNFLGNLPISFFLLHSEKVRELVFQSSHRVKKKEKRFNLPLYCLVSSCRKKVLQEDGISLTSVSTYFHDFRVDIEYLSWESFWRRIVKKTSTYNVID